MWNSHRIKKGKKLIHKISYESLNKIVSDSIRLFWDFSINYCGDNVKYGLLSKHLFQGKPKCGGWKISK